MTNAKPIPADPEAIEEGESAGSISRVAKWTFGGIGVAWVGWFVASTCFASQLSTVAENRLIPAV